MPDVLTRQQRSFTMSRIRKTNTKPEILVRKFLFSKGYRFRIHYKRLKGNPDIVFVKDKIAIFVNGCFWHAHKNCKLNRMPKSNQYYWIPKIEKNVQRDLENKNELKKVGWKVITIWECNLNKREIHMFLNRMLNKIEKIKINGR